jgi:predicted O-methyltransferase YrrM
VFCEDIGPNLIVEISELLGVKCALSSGLVGAVYQTTKENTVVLDVAGLSALDEAFDELYDIYRCDESIIKHSKTDALINKISVIIGKIRNCFDEPYISNADVREETDAETSSSIRSVWVDDARESPQLLSTSAIRKSIIESFHGIYGKDRGDNYSKSLSSSGFEFFEDLIRRVNYPDTIRYLEIGSFEGVSMVVVASLLRNSGHKAVLTSIDPYLEDGYWESNPVLGEMFKVSDKSTKKKAFSFYEAMGFNVEHFEDVSNVVLIDLLRTERSFDLIYVDGYHEKTVPLEDIGLSMSLLSEDGVLIIDDWIWPDVLPIKTLFDLHMEKIAEHPMMVAYRRRKTS